MSESKPKKRGRPRNPVVAKQIIKNNKEEDEIILRLQTFSDDKYESSTTCTESDSNSNSEDNVFFTINETTDGGHKNIKAYSPDNDNETHTNSDDLHKELKNKEKIIKKLTDQVNYMNTFGTYSANTATRDIVKQLHDLKLLDVSSSASIKISGKTKIKCWHCTYNFNGPPFFIPDAYINGYFYVFGCFCSLNCAATYNLNTLNDSRTKTRHSLILMLFHKIFGTNNKLVYAPRKELLEDYGGLMTINKFRESFMTINKEHTMKIPPMLPLVYEIETRTNDTVETVIMSE
jgi:hypothetical protein